MGKNNDQNDNRPEDTVNAGLDCWEAPSLNGRLVAGFVAQKERSAAMVASHHAVHPHDGKALRFSTIRTDSVHG